jgi:hypothetical protein
MMEHASTAQYLFTLRVDRVDRQLARLSNGTKDVFIVHLCCALDSMRDLM